MLSLIGDVAHLRAGSVRVSVLGVIVPPCRRSRRRRSLFCARNPHFAREILVPITLAVLLSFVLSPLVRALQRLNLPRSMAVLAAACVATAIALSLATMVMIEVNQLANDLPRYQSTLGEKIHNLRNTIGRVGVLKNASSLLKDLDKELKSPDAATRKPRSHRYRTVPESGRFRSKSISRFQGRPRL
jgi:AI-2E family transporter